jgi:hypothetical protein
MTMPLFSLSLTRTSSGTSRGWAQSARVDECENMTGARVAPSAACIVSACTCEMSTTMPIRFISFTTDTPKGARPPSGASTQKEPCKSARGGGGGGAGGGAPVS